MNVHTSSYLDRFAEPDGYLDFARFGPVSRDVAEEMRASAELVRGGGALAVLDALAEDARGAGAELLAAAGHEVAFVSSTSHGLFAAAQALSRARGTVLVPRDDFPANVYPWLRAAERGGLQVRWIEGRVTADAVRELLDERVRAVAVCAVDSGTGARPPLGALKELIGRDRVLVVDAIQGLGAVELETEAADVLAAGGQKWLRAGWGAAYLLVRDRIAHLLTPGLGGWSGVGEPLDGDHPRPPLPGARAHTFTNPAGPAVAALGTATRLVLKAGVPAVEALIRDRLDGLLEAARSAGAEVMAPAEAGIGLFRLPGRDPAHLHRSLDAAGITTTLRGSWIRLSPHATTHPETAAHLAAVLHTPQGDLDA